MVALVLFACAMIVLAQLVHATTPTTRAGVLAEQIGDQIEPFLLELDAHNANGQKLKARFSLAVVKKTFDIFDGTLSAKIALYSPDGQLLVQTNHSDFPKEMPHTKIWTFAFAPFSSSPVVQTKTQGGYTLWYEMRQAKPQEAAVLNLFSGTLILLVIMGLVLYFFAKSITRQVDALSVQMRRFGEGDFSARAPIYGNDEIAKLAQGFNQAVHKIERLMRANGLLLAHASHEFRTPLTRMRLQIEMLDMLGQTHALEGEFSRRLNSIKEDLAGLDSLMEDILLVSRLEAGGALENADALDIHTLIADECAHFKNTHFAGELLEVYGQARLLIHLIQNLINNAHIHGKAPVWVFLFGAQATDSDIPAHLIDQIKGNALPTTCPLAHPKYALICVVDQGTGIHIDKREDIFGAFVRLKQEKAGSGLGLSLVAQITEAHAGSIKTDLWHDKTRFVVALPIYSK